MKRLIIFALGVIFYFTASSQSTPLYTDNFESYPIGTGIAFSNPGQWATWNNLPGSAEDGLINILQSSSGTQSVLIDNIPSQTDLLLKLGDKTSGKYDLYWKMYFETGAGGYYNIQHFEAPGIEWACEVWFNGDGTGTVYAGLSTYPFNFAHNMWFRVENIIDLDNDHIKLIIGGTVVGEWPFSYQTTTTTGTKQLGAVDFFAATSDGSTPKYYLDDVSFTRFENFIPYMEDFESFNHLDYMALENPTWWKTWSNLAGTGQDGRIISGLAYSGVNKLVIDYVPVPTDLVLKLGERTSGKYKLSWQMYVQSSYGGYYNIQHFEPVGLEFAFEAFFDANGTGFLATGASNFPFVYPKDTWFPVVHIIDLDNDRIQLFINAALVNDWPFSYKTGGTNGTNQLGGVDFFAATNDGSPAQYFIDDIIFRPTNQATIPVSNWPIYIVMGLILASTVIIYLKKR